MVSKRYVVFFGLVLIVSLFIITGCSIVSHGRLAKITHNHVDAIQVGVSTKEDIIKLLGKPQKVMHKSNKMEVFIYIHGIERSIGIPFLISWGRAGGTGQTLRISFDQYGVVMDYDYVTDDRGMIE